MGTYILTKKIEKILRSRGYDLICKHCGCPLISGLSRAEAEKLGKLDMLGDEIESKQQRRGKSKLYHKKCYDESHIDIPAGENDDKELEDFFKRPIIRLLLRRFIHHRRKR
jgi:hypothetical protein